MSPLFGGPAVTAGATAAGAVSPGKAAAGWYRAPVKIGLSATDGGWGVARTQYSLNGAIGWLTADSVTVSNNGKTTVTYNAVDRAGNAAALKTITVHVDKVKPVPKALNAIRTKRGAWFTLKLKSYRQVVADLRRDDRRQEGRAQGQDVRPGTAEDRPDVASQAALQAADRLVPLVRLRDRPGRQPPDQGELEPPDGEVTAGASRAE